MAVDHYALCVGINDYPGSDFDLSGCKNDADDWAELLANRHFGVETLIDQQATRAAFLDRLGDAIGALGYRDRLVVTFSGHGSWVPDLSGDERDGRDECLVMADFEYVLDDDLAALFAQRPRGSRIVFISDSCHSGTVNRLYDSWEPKVEDAPHPVKPRFIPPGVILDRQRTQAAHAVEEAPTRGFLRTSSCLLVSGCLDHEYSYDAWFGQRPNGAFTRYAIDVLGTHFGANPVYGDWLAELRTVLPSDRYPQTPDLNGSYPQRRRWKTFE